MRPFVKVALLFVPLTGMVHGYQEAKPEVSLARAHELFMSGAYDEAAEAYGTLIEAPRNTLAAAIGLTRCQMQVGEYESAKTTLRGVDGSQSADWHILAARLARLFGDYDKTLEHARKAIKIDAKAGNARLLLAETLDMLGRRDEAIEEYRWFDKRVAGGGDLPNDAEALTALGVGFLRYSVMTGTNVPDRTRHVLQQMLQMAYERVDRTYWPARIAAADLLRERYNNDEEDGSVSDYEAALKINPRLPSAHVGLAEVALNSWQFEKVEEHIQAARDVNPKYPPALYTLAKKLLLERRYDESRKVCDEALALNPNDIAALAISAGAAACQYDQDTVDAITKRVAQINPNCALFHRAVGDALSGIRQYAESEREYLTAIGFDPTDANARTELGLMYMQWGHEEKARDALAAAFAIDPYNQRTKFTLDLLDQLQSFTTYETEHFIIRYDAERDPGLGEYAALYLEPIYDMVTADYDCTLDTKTTIEFFPTSRSFAVRITGKPWIHTVGACTGSVIAMATSKQSTELIGRYNMADVLTHEFTHTVTLAVTDNRIPHWFTEGLAVYEESSPAGFGWLELLADAIRHDRLFTMESIDWGFIRPKRRGDSQMAYAQSEWMVEYIIERFGYDSINKMLELYRKGRVQEEVFRELFSISLDEFERDFKAWAKEQAKGWCFDLNPPENVMKLREMAEESGASASVFGRLAQAEFDVEEYEEAEKAARHALEIDPDEVNALTVMVKQFQHKVSQLHKKDPAIRSLQDEALPWIERLLDADPAGWIAPKARAEIALSDDDSETAEKMLERLQSACPQDPFSWRGLAGLYLQQGNDDGALPQLVELARIETHDPDVPAKIAKISQKKGKLREAEYWYRQALAIDAFSVANHQALGDVYLQTGDNKQALREYQMLTKLEPNEAKHYESAAIAAKRAGEEELLKELVDRAVKLNPDSPSRSLLQSEHVP